MLKKNKTVTILDFDECIEDCKKAKVLTKKEADLILEYMRGGLEGHYWCMYLETVEEKEKMKTSDAVFYRKFYDRYKKYAFGKKGISFKRIMFDCTVYS